MDDLALVRNFLGWVMQRCIGYWQELIESIIWAHQLVATAPAIYPRALSIIQGRAVGVAHYLLGGIVTTWSFFEARSLSIGS